MPIGSGAADIFKNMSSPEHVLTIPNTVTDGMLGLSIFGLTYVVLMFVMFGAMRGRTNGEKEAFLGASVVMIPISILMTVLQLLDVTITIFPIVLSVIGLMILARVND